MKLKPGVRIAGVRPELLIGLMVADRIFSDEFQVELVVTSVIDAVHMQGSKHYVGQAADLRIIKLGDQAEACLARLKAELDELFDIVLEKDHIHMEYDS